MKYSGFGYYGYDRQTYENCGEQISSTNRIHALMMELWFIVNNFLYVIFSIMGVFGVTKSDTTFYTTFLVISLAYGIFTLFLRSLTEKYTAITVYLNISMLLIYGIAVSAAKPYMAATMFPLLMVLAAVAYIDNMLRMMLVLTGYSAAFLISSYSQKAVTIAWSDSYNVVMALILAAALHYSFSRTMIAQFVLYHKNLQGQRELEIRSSFDALTSLLNRGRFFSMAEKALREVHDEYLALCLLDLDGFKQINDNLGHQMGDKAIQTAGETILRVMKIDEGDKWSFPQRVVREKGSFAGRLGGDEFIIFLRGYKDKTEVEQVLEKIREELNAVRFDRLNGIHASFGVTELTERDMDLDEAYKRADACLYESKRTGKNRINFAED